MSEPTPVRILVVDDDDVDRMNVIRSLRKAGVDLVAEERTSCVAALAALKESTFDCVVLDYFLPDGNGLNVVRQARAAGLRAPILILTGQGDEEIAVELMKAGASDYIPKSGASPARIAQTIRSAVRVYHAERAAAAAERERARLGRLEQEARTEAEDAQRRLAFLAEASSIVAASLDYSTTLENVAHLAVPTLADWCFVDLKEADGGFHRVAVAHHAKEGEDAARRFRRRYGPLPDAPHGVSRVIETGTPEITTDTPDWILVAVARDADHLELLRGIGIRSTMCVPLVARGRTLGAITFISAESGRRYTLRDLAFAEELARRAAVAVDNSRLYQDAVAAEERLRRQLEFTSAITASLAEGVCALDAEGRFTFVNPAAETMLGWPARDLHGRALTATIHFEDADGVPIDPARDPLERAIREGRVYRADADTFRRRDGTRFSVSYSSSPIRAGDRHAGAVLVFHDITERKRADDRMRFQARLLEAVGQGVVGLDMQGRITYWNRAAERIHGASAEQAIGHDLLEVAPPESGVDATRSVLARAFAGKPWSGELRMRRLDGGEFWAAFSTTPFFDAGGRQVGVIGIFEDVTDRKAALEELEASRRQMALNEKLSALGTLISGVAHEIRTPLTYLANNIFLAQTRLEVAAREHPELAPVVTEVARFGTGALDGVERIHTLVKDLRAFVVPEGGRRVAAPVHEVAAGAVELFRATHRGRVDVEADLQPTPLASLDKGQIQRVVINLLVNAAEAMALAGGVIRVQTRPAPGGAEIVVADNGCGIPPDVEARMFDPFYTTKPDGTGLGLSITRRIVEAHGGRIRHASKVGKGTTFVIHLPALPPAAADAARTLVPAAPEPPT